MVRWSRRSQNEQLAGVYMHVSARLLHGFRSLGRGRTVFEAHVLNRFFSRLSVERLTRKTVIQFWLSYLQAVSTHV